MDRPFIHISTQEAPLLLNLLQVVKAEIAHDQNDTLTLRMSDGSNNVFHGKEMATQIIALLTQYACELNGSPMTLVSEAETSQRE